MKRNGIIIPLLLCCMLIVGVSPTFGAGISKPTVAGLGAEQEFTLLSTRTYVERAASIESSQVSGLFDGVTTGDRASKSSGYFAWDGDYLELEIKGPCNIWRAGTSDDKSLTGQFQILRYENSQYVDVTNQFPQIVESISETQWSKTISNLPAGRYKFMASNRSGMIYRLDSEWYLEATGAPVITDPVTPENPTNNTTKAIIEITLNNGKIKEYEVTAAELAKYQDWFDKASEGTGKKYYTFVKTVLVKPFTTRKETIQFKDIETFEVKEY